MHETIRYGVIGYGGTGENHLRGATQADGAELRACADLDEERARAAADAFDCAWYTDHVEMIEAEEIDIVSICTPSGTHSDIAIDCAEAGVHVLCEKPLDVYRERVDAMLAAAERHGVTLGGIFQRRLGGGQRMAKQVVEDGALGPISQADLQVKWYRKQDYYTGWSGTRDLDGGVLMQQAIHGVDLLQWVMGGIKEVSAETTTLHREMECEDNAVVNVRFADGSLGHIAASTTCYPQEPIILKIHGLNGTIRLHDDEVNHFATRKEADYEPEPHPLGVGREAQVQDIVNAVRENREPIVPGREARKAVDTVLAAYESVERDGEWINVEEM